MPERLHSNACGDKEKLDYLFISYRTFTFYIKLVLIKFYSRKLLSNYEKDKGKQKRPEPSPTNILQRKFYAMLIF